MARKNIKILAGLIAMALFVLMVFYAPRFFEQEVPGICFDGEICQHEEYLESVIAYIPGVIVLGFLFGLIVSYMYFERKLEVPLPATDKKAVLLSLLEPSERKVLAKIVEGGGEALQSDVSRVEGVGKVKAHRILERLVKRGVIHKEQKGKTNILRLKREILEALGN